MTAPKQIERQDKGEFERRCLALGGEITRNSFPDLHTTQATASLIRLERKGVLRLVSKGGIGRHGQPAVYRLAK